MRTKKINPLNLYLTSLHEVFGGRCLYCRCRTSLKARHKSESHAATLDHIKPRSKGGKDEFPNLVLACRKCNNQRGNQSLERWLPLQPFYQDGILELVRCLTSPPINQILFFTQLEMLR